MEEKIIKAKSGKYGRVQIILPLHIKTDVLAWAKKSGINKSAYLRMALMIGASQLAELIRVKNANETYSKRSDAVDHAPART